MPKSTIIAMLVLAVAAVALGFNYFFRPFANLIPPPPVATEPTPPPPPEPQLVTESLSPEAKIAQLLAVPITLSQDQLDASDSAWVAARQPGFVTLFGTQISTAAATMAITELSAHPAASELPTLVIVDHEGGSVQRLNGEGFTTLPTWRSLCAQTATSSGQLLANSAAELSAAGVDIVLAPVIDVASSSATLGNRICSGNPEVVADRANVYVTAMAEASIQPVLKHFPGIGQTTRDLHRNFDRMTVNQAEAGIYLQLLDQYPGLGVMTSHAGITNQYPDIPCSLSPACVGQVASNYPTVLIFSDALEMDAAGFSPNKSELKPLTQRAAEAILAGNDVLIFGPSVTTDDLDEMILELTERYQTDPTFSQAVDTHLLKIEARKRVGL